MQALFTEGQQTEDWHSGPTTANESSSGVRERENHSENEYSGEKAFSVTRYNRHLVRSGRLESAEDRMACQLGRPGPEKNESTLNGYYLRD